MGIALKFRKGDLVRYIDDTAFWAVAYGLVLGERKGVKGPGNYYNVHWLRKNIRDIVREKNIRKADDNDA